MRSWLRGKRGGLIAFLGIAGLVVGGLGWVTAAVLRLEESQHRADFDRELNAQLSLVMWRLDSRVAPALAREDSRPYNHYNAVFAPAVLVRNDGTPLKPGEVVEPSPLLSAELPDWMLLHFQADADLGWESPQVLSKSLVHILENRKITAPLDNVTPQRGRLLVDLDRSLAPAALVGCVKNCNVQQSAQVDTTLVPPGANPIVPQQGQTLIAPNSQNPDTYASDPVNLKKPYGYANDQESVKRGTVRDRAQKDMQPSKSQVAELSWALANTARNGESWFRHHPAPTGKSKKTTVRVGPMVPLWISPAPQAAQQVDNPLHEQQTAASVPEERLVIARLVEIGERQRCQGVVLDWQRLQEVLVEEARETFPEAKLEPIRGNEPPNPEREMKWLRVRLDPGPIEPPPMARWTPLRGGLALAWMAALVALSVVGLGGWSLIDLSQRRIRFVSAVTHELRTPLTTLRLYLDMLTGGLVQEEKQRSEYLATLHSETERLNRLVANVLDFSRLENQRPRLEKAPVRVVDLLEQVRTDWQGRCQSAEKELVLDNALPDDAQVVTDVKLVQQVLGNLIDNACKYSRGAEDRRIWLRAHFQGKRLLLEVEDRGPGVSAADGRSIFRPFRRGRDADVTAGGVGLGLALAQRWAQFLGGRLTLNRSQEGAGACFRLVV